MASLTLTPSGYNGSLSSYQSVNSEYPLRNGLSGSDSDNYAELYLLTGTRATSTLAVNFDVSQIPSGATIDSIECKIKARISNSSPYVLTGIAQLYWNATAMGGEVELGTSAIAQTFNDVGYWDYDRLQQLFLLITCTRGVMGGSNSQTLRFYGADLVVNYTAGSTEPTKKLWFKDGSVYKSSQKPWKKSGGAWALQTDLENVFDANTKYVKG